jgi:hypothetical protein
LNTAGLRQQVAEGEEKEAQEVPNVCTGENTDYAFCAVCCDKSLFFTNEMEEWQQCEWMTAKLAYPL